MNLLPLAPLTWRNRRPASSVASSKRRRPATDPEPAAGGGGGTHLGRGPPRAGAQLLEAPRLGRRPLQITARPVDPGQVVVRLGELGIGGDRLLEGLDGFVEPTLQREQPAELGESALVSGIE